MHADLDTLCTFVYCTADDLLPEARGSAQLPLHWLSQTTSSTLPTSPAHAQTRHSKHAANGWCWGLLEEACESGIRERL
jgi:hypothetical protein